jgi:poly[(R)-3-hydroxyalkanoate] polymerase subunit PhaE
MAETSTGDEGIRNLLDSWMQIGGNILENVKQSQGENPNWANFNFDLGNNGADEKTNNTNKNWEESFSNFTSLFKNAASPKHQEWMAKSGMTFLEALTAKAGDSSKNFAELQNQLQNAFTKMGQHMSSCEFDDLEKMDFETFRDLYKSEFQKYFYVPKIGLPREKHEQLSELADKTTVFNSHLLELVYLFSLPFDKTNRAMQDKHKRMAENGEFIEDSKQEYSDWIKILEGHFSELLTSKKYIKVLNNTITSLADYKNVKTNVTNDFLKEMQIPTYKEMDEVYQDLHQMKSTIKMLSKEVQQLKK